MGGEVLVVGIFFGILCDKEKLVTVWSDVAWWERKKKYSIVNDRPLQF